MRRRTKGLLVAAAAAGLCPWLPGWLTAAGLDPWNAPALRRQVEANLREEAALTAQIAEAQDDIRAKDRLAEELAAGRITLADAIDRFEALVQARPAVADGLRFQYPDAATDRERVARHVVDYTRTRLADADQQSRLAARMASELALLFPRPAHPMG
jgi:hypothetical protein